MSANNRGGAAPAPSATGSLLPRSMVVTDANEAVSRMAYALNEVIALYPITPSTPMGEWADVWASAGVKNLWGTVPSIIQMQSEAGVAGAIHGAVQTGSLGTTFTASQGLLLMIPNMYRIAGELTPCVIHVAARSLAAQALSIFGDHSDVMAARGTGWAMLCSASVQEAQDFALIAQAASLESRIPCLHFFDGFRTSHEIAKIARLDEDVLQAMIDERWIEAHRARALSPDHPVLRGTTQNPDIYFQAREAVNPYYAAFPGILQKAMDRFARLTGRQYHNFEYHGHEEAERVIVLMGSAIGAVRETVDFLMDQGEKVGVLKVRLYRPFDASAFRQALPATVQALAILDRCKEPGSAGEPLYLDCLQSLYQSERRPSVSGGRYGLSSKEFTPAMVLGIFRNLQNSAPSHPFTIGIQDDLGGTSLDYDAGFSLESPAVSRAIFYGFGADGTVGANKQTIKIIGENAPDFVQGYFVYDSKKSGAVTVGHLRFGPEEIHSSYLISRAQFVACHQESLLEKMDVTEPLMERGIFLLNSHHPPEKVWAHLPEGVQRALIDRQAQFYVINAYRVARDGGLGGHINTIMQVCFFSLSKVLRQDLAMEAIRASIRKTYEAKGPEVVEKNLAAVDHALAHLHEVNVPQQVSPRARSTPSVPPDGSSFERDVLGKLLAGKGDSVPVSALSADGTFPTGTARWEKRNLAAEVPVWNADICIQCGKCVMVCPHAAIRGKAYEPAALVSPPHTFKSRPARLPAWKGLAYSLQVAVEDCTGCGICVDVCPVRDKTAPEHKALTMHAPAALRSTEKANWSFFLGLPERDRRQIHSDHVRELHIQQPLFEFSGACSGCGETPYIRILSQLFGDRLIVANATGCSSIYGGNMPTTPWSKNNEGRGPAWSNSLFEDNAEFGMGFRVSVDKQRQFARELVRMLAPRIGVQFATEIMEASQNDEAGIYEQRLRVAQLKQKLSDMDTPESRRLLTVADTLVRKSVWIIGGDGWGYDIGFGGLDHVLASGANVKVLLLDTEEYSNTGGQCSKATPRAAVARFASSGKRTPKKDLGLIAMNYGHIYVASIALGANDEHTMKAFLEAEAYDGPALLLAYSHCIAHGIDMSKGMQNQKAAAKSGHWLLYRYDPRREAEGLNPLQLEPIREKTPLYDYHRTENRFRKPPSATSESPGALSSLAQQDVDRRWRRYQEGAAHPSLPMATTSTTVPGQRA